MKILSILLFSFFLNCKENLNEESLKKEEVKKIEPETESNKIDEESFLQEVEEKQTVKIEPKKQEKTPVIKFVLNDIEYQMFEEEFLNKINFFSYIIYEKNYSQLKEAEKKKINKVVLIFYIEERYIESQLSDKNANFKEDQLYKSIYENKAATIKEQFENKLTLLKEENERNEKDIERVTTKQMYFVSKKDTISEKLIKKEFEKLKKNPRMIWTFQVISTDDKKQIEKIHSNLNYMQLDEVQNVYKCSVTKDQKTIEEFSNFFSVDKQELIKLKGNKISKIMFVNNTYYILIFDSITKLEYNFLDCKQLIINKIIEESMSNKCREIFSEAYIDKQYL